MKQCLTQNAARRPMTTQVLLQPHVQQKLAELEIAMPDNLLLPAEPQQEPQHEPAAHAEDYGPAEVEADLPQDAGDSVSPRDDDAEQAEFRQQELDYQRQEDDEPEVCTHAAQSQQPMQTYIVCLHWALKVHAGIILASVFAWASEQGWLQGKAKPLFSIAMLHGI